VADIDVQNHDDDGRFLVLVSADVEHEHQLQPRHQPVIVVIVRRYLDAAKLLALPMRRKRSWRISKPLPHLQFWKSSQSKRSMQ
jgi:hypothetical protein